MYVLNVLNTRKKLFFNLNQRWQSYHTQRDVIYREGFITYERLWRLENIRSSWVWRLSCSLQIRANFAAKVDMSKNWPWYVTAAARLYKFQIAMLIQCNPKKPTLFFLNSDRWTAQRQLQLWCVIRLTYQNFYLEVAIHNFVRQ